MAPTAHDESGIVTPEAIVLEFADAGLGSRTLGFVIDLVVRGMILWAMLTVVALVGPLLSETVLAVVSIVGAFVALLVYPVVCETLWNGRTVGKMILGLRAVTVEGAPVRFRHAVIRSSLGLVDFWITVGSAAILCALATRQSQRLGDLAAGTIVVRERQAGAQAQPIVFEPAAGWEPYVAALDVSGLDDDHYVIVRSFLLRVHELREPVRAERGAEVAAWVAERLGVEVPAQHHPETFLVAVAAAYQARHGGPKAATGPWGGASPGAIPPPVWQEDQPRPTWGVSST